MDNIEISSLTFFDVTKRKPPDKIFVLVLCPSNYSTIKNVIVTARQWKDFRGERWIDEGNDMLSDYGLVPAYWAHMPLLHLD